MSESCGAFELMGLLSVQRENFAKHACIVFVILTHGTRYDMISARDELYSIDDDILFPMVRNDTLRGKPKIILVQACKGDKEIEIYADSAKSSPGGNPDEILKFYSTFEGKVMMHNFFLLFGSGRDLDSTFR